MQIIPNSNTPVNLLERKRTCDTGAEWWHHCVIPAVCLLASQGVMRLAEESTACCTKERTEESWKLHSSLFSVLWEFLPRTSEIGIFWLKHSTPFISSLQSAGAVWCCWVLSGSRSCWGRSVVVQKGASWRTGPYLYISSHTEMSVDVSCTSAVVHGLPCYFSCLCVRTLLEILLEF